MQNLYVQEEKISFVYKVLLYFLIMVNIFTSIFFTLVHWQLILIILITLLLYRYIQILGITQTGISDFPIFGQFLIKENYYNSRTSDDIDINLGPVTKIDNRYNTT